MAFRQIFKLQTVLVGVLFFCGCETFAKKDPTYLVRKQNEENNGAYIISNPRTLLAGGNKIEINKKAALDCKVVPEKPPVKVPSDVELSDALNMRRQKERHSIVAYQCTMGTCGNESMHMHIQTPAKVQNISVNAPVTEKVLVSNDLKIEKIAKEETSEKLWKNDKNKIINELDMLKRKIDKQLTQNNIGDAAERKTYVVKQGDSLWEIAGLTLGNPYRWMEIYSANRDILTSPHQLYPGLTLILPEKEMSENSTSN